MSRHWSAPPELICQQEPWMTTARCRGQTELMFRESRVDEARALCEGCGCREPCLAYALSFGPQLWGVWAGLDRSERLRLLSEAA